MKKIMLVANNGGHILQLAHLRNIWERYDRVWVTGNKQDATYLLQGEKIYYAYRPTDRNLKNMFKNMLLAFKIFWLEKPAWVVTTGAGMAIPFCYVAKLFRIKVMYIESFAKIRTPTVSGRIVYPISNAFFVQWQGMLKYYPKAHYEGTIYDDILDSRSS